MQKKFLVLSALVFGAPLALHTPVVSAQQQGTAGTYSGSNEAATTPRDAEGGRPIPRAQRSPSNTVDQAGKSGMSGQSSAQGAASTPRDAEGGRPIPQAKRSPSDTPDQAEPGLSGKSATSTEAVKSPRDAEGGFPFGGSRSTVQGYFGAGQPSSDETKQIQQALKDKGHDPGRIDGIMGSKTRAALRDFQKENGLQASGTLDDETASALGVTAASESSSKGSHSSAYSQGSGSAASGSSSR